MTEPEQILVFDLDDTLYLERDFVSSGYRACGRWLEANVGFRGFAAICEALFDSGQRTHIFDKALAVIDLCDGQRWVPDIVDIYRNHRPEISLQTDAESFLAKSRRSRRMAMITDGALQTQMNKVAALRLAPRLDRIVFTGQWGPGYCKPHPRSYRAIEKWAGVAGRRLVYIADNPAKDFITPRARGWVTVRILRPDRVHHLEAPTALHEAHLSIGSLHELDDCLNEKALRSLWKEP